MIAPKPYVLKSDRSIIVLSKPPEMSVHPPSPEASDGQAPLEREETLVDWLARLDPYLEQRFPKVVGEIWRPGIVHRLDKDTSGLMVIARTPEALRNLQAQFKGRTVKKVYRALVAGVADETGEFAGAIARSDDDPTKQQVRRLTFSWSKGTAREAETSYQRLALSNPVPGTGLSVSLVKLSPKTGRMHQLRVQLADAGWPILGDERYETKASRKLSDELDVKRQLLHAMTLEFAHPDTGERRTYCMGYPLDFLRVLQRLELPADSCEDRP